MTPKQAFAVVVEGSLPSDDESPTSDEEAIRRQAAAAAASHEGRLSVEDGNDCNSEARMAHCSSRHDDETCLVFSSFAHRPAILYATVFCWISVTGGRFLAPFLEHEAGLSTVNVGLLLAMQKLVGMPATAIAGRASDRLEILYPGLGRSCTVATGILTGTLFYLLQAASRFSNIQFFMAVPWYFVLQVLYSIASSLVFPVLDGMCLQYLERNAKKEDYGKERLYGAITWAITNLGMAPALDKVGFVITYPLAIASALAVLISLYIYSRANLPSKSRYSRLKKRSSDLPVIAEEKRIEVQEVVERTLHEDSSNDANRGNEIATKKLLQHLLFGTTPDRAWFFGCAFLWATMVLAVGQVIVESLVFLFFEYLGSSFFVMGWTVVLTIAFEIPIFHIASTLLERFGATALLQAAMVCYIVRVVGYTLIPQGHVAYALLLEPLHGVTFACSTTATVDFVAQSMPVGYEATGQGFVYFVRGLGSVFGLLLGGWAEDSFGPRIMYRSAAIVVATGSAVLGAASFLQQQLLQQQQQQQQRREVVPQCDDVELTQHSCNVSS